MKICPKGVIQVIQQGEKEKQEITTKKNYKKWRSNIRKSSK